MFSFNILYSLYPSVKSNTPRQSPNSNSLTGNNLRVQKNEKGKACNSSPAFSCSSTDYLLLFELLLFLQFFWLLSELLLFVLF